MAVYHNAVHISMGIHMAMAENYFLSPKQYVPAGSSMSEATRMTDAICFCCLKRIPSKTRRTPIMLSRAN